MPNETLKNKKSKKIESLIKRKSKGNKKEVNMKKIGLICFILFFIILLIIGCATKLQDSSNKKITLSDLQIEACNSADAAKTCDTRLAEVGIVLKEDCCKELGKCC